jgi:hypothetical protein
MGEVLAREVGRKLTTWRISRRGQRIKRGLSGYSSFNYWWPWNRFDCDNRFWNGNQYLRSSGWKGTACTSSSAGVLGGIESDSAGG